MTKARVDHQLLRLHVLLGDDEAQLDELYQAFQETDKDGRGSLASATYDF
jgi:Ca2+-binding EF-hand superfamily protein